MAGSTLRQQRLTGGCPVYLYPAFSNSQIRMHPILCAQPTEQDISCENAGEGEACCSQFVLVGWRKSNLRVKSSIFEDEHDTTRFFFSSYA